MRKQETKLSYQPPFNGRKELIRRGGALLSSVFQVFSIRNEKAKLKAVVGVQNCQNMSETRGWVKSWQGVGDKNLWGSELTKH